MVDNFGSRGVKFSYLQSQKRGGEGERLTERGGKYKYC